MRLFITYLLSCTISKILQIIGQICAVDIGGVPVFNTLIGGEPLTKFRIAKYGLKLENPFIVRLKCMARFDILNSFGVTHDCVRQTGEQTDGRTF